MTVQAGVADARAMHSTASRTTLPRVPELDVLRGWAAVLMVFNHVGFAVLSPQAATQGFSGAMVFLGSMAPVVFFFATGFGAGLAPPARWGAVLDKVVLLLAADFLLTWRLGHTTPRLDFFGFIAVSMVAVRLAQSTPRPMIVAGAAALGVLLLRYVGGRWLDDGTGDYGVLRWWVGRFGHEAVSYPAAPWLAYPWAGLMLGMAWRECGGRPSARAWFVFVAVGASFAAAAAAMAWRGESFFRWGSVGPGFFATSVAVLAALSALSVALVRAAPRVAAALSLGGVAAFALVPLHYAAVHALAGAPDVSTALYLAVAGTVTALAFVLSRRFERWVAAQGHAGRRSPASWWALGLIVVAALSMVLLAHQGHTLASLWMAALAQLGIGALFAWRVGVFAPAARRA
jgi:hypothetical protein